ncbi:MAG: DNA-binding protein, partial [Acetatifactor sp.]|nr:DNA-binding protein [Acetatifactor sp.]
LLITHEKKGEINMAAPKKTVKPVAKAAETVKTEAVKPETVKAVTSAPKAEAKAPAAEAPKAEAKKEPATKAVKKPKTAKAETAKKPAAKRTVKKADQKSNIYVQFSGKSYSQEELIKMAQDVWKYDLKQKVRELATIELYVKPEENKVYYVMNQDFTGDFNI